MITLNPSNGTRITIGTQKGEGLKFDKILVSSTTQQKIRLKPDSYIVKYSGSVDSRDEYTTIKVDKAMKITTPKLSYTQTKLDQLLPTEKPAIQNAISSSYKVPGYTINDYKIYQQGDWSSARLIYKDASRDNLRVILNKVNGKWQILAGPMFIVSILDNPSIPQEVIRTANKAGFY